MSTTCPVVTPQIQKLCDQITQKYTVFNFTGPQMVAEWVGMYINKNNIKNPDFIPDIDNLVSMVEHERNKEGKTLLGYDTSNNKKDPGTLKQILSHLRNIGITLHNKSEMDAFLKEKGVDNIQALFSQDKKEALKNVPVISIDNDTEYSIFLTDAFTHQDRVESGIGYANTFYNFYVYDLDKEGFPTPKYKIPINERNKELIKKITRGERLSKEDRTLADSLLLTEIQSKTEGSVLPHFLELSTSDGAIQDLASGTMEQGIEGERSDLPDADAAGNTDSKAYRRESARISREIGTIILNAKKKGTLFKAPNGKPTNLSPVQWIMVRTKNFKNWFGDWENDPQNASKVVDENGEPLKVYHGTDDAGFTVFDPQYSDDHTSLFFYNTELNAKGYISGEIGVKDTGIEISKDEEWVTDKDLNDYIKEGYVVSDEDKQRYNNGESIRIRKEGEKKQKESAIYHLFLNIKKPLTVDAKGGQWDNIRFNGQYLSTREISKYAKDNGYDGVIFRNINDLGVSSIHKLEHYEKEIMRANVYGYESNSEDELKNLRQKLYNNDVYVAYNGTQIKSASDDYQKSNNGRYSTTNPDIQELRTKSGELFGFTYNGEIYIDETKLSPEVPLHEYTHVWDVALAKVNPKLWAKGVDLMKQTSLWNNILNNTLYGKKWQSRGITGSKLDSLIASEVHSRLVGENGAKLLVQLANEKGQEGIIAKLKDWILEAWKALKATFSNWSQEEIDKLTLDDFNHMVVRDFADGINPNNINATQTANSIPNHSDTLTVDEVLNQYFNTTDTISKNLANIVFTTAKQLGITFRYIDSKSIQDNEYGEVVGKYKLDEMTVYINKENSLPNTILHETIHAVTTYYMEADDNLLSPEILKAKKEIEYCYELLKQDFIEQHFYKNGKLKKGINVSKAFPFWISSSNDTYGYTSPEEMVAELSNPEFLEHIKDFDRRHKDLSIFDKLIDAILKMIGVRPSYESLEKTLKKAVATMISNPDKRMLTQAAFERKTLKGNLNEFKTYNDNIVKIFTYPKLEQEMEAQEDNVLTLSIIAENIQIPKDSQNSLTIPQKGTILEFNSKYGIGHAVLLDSATIKHDTATKMDFVIVKAQPLSSDYLSKNNVKIAVNDNHVAYIQSTSPTVSVNQHNNSTPNHYTGNITPDANTIFVFGSNPEGRHGAGAAKVAREHFGAIYGQGEGLQGNAYALPTKDLRVKKNRGFRSIPREQIIENIKKLYQTARENPSKQFKVAYRNKPTETSLNGYTGAEMIEMFKAAGSIPSNIYFSEEWVNSGLFNNTSSSTSSPASESSQSSQGQQGEAGSFNFDFSQMDDAFGAASSEGTKNLHETQEQQPEKERPKSNIFESALHVPDSRLTKFRHTFTLQQRHDRANAIATNFSMAIDDVIYERQDYYNDILNSEDSTPEEKLDAEKWLEVYNDPIKGRMAAVEHRSYSVLLDDAKQTMVDEMEQQTDNDIKQRYANTIEYFDLLALEAKKVIKEKEGIDTGRQEEITDEDEDFDENEEGNAASGNEGWNYKVRFVNPFSKLSKAVKRMINGMETGKVDDLGYPKTYSQAYVYSALVSYLSKHVESPDDFITITPVEKYKDMVDEDDPEDVFEDSDGLPIDDYTYPNGYPTFPALEQMAINYPWVHQLITKLEKDCRNKELSDAKKNWCTGGDIASQFYMNFKQSFIPHCKIQVGVKAVSNGEKQYYFGVTNLNYDMEAQSQLQSLCANYNNGITLSNRSVYNTDRTLNKENTKEVKRDILIAQKELQNLEQVFRAHTEYGDPLPEGVNKKIGDIVDIFRAFGIDTTQESIIGMLLTSDEYQGTKLGQALANLDYAAKQIIDDLNENSNFLVDIKDWGNRKKGSKRNLWDNFFSNDVGVVTEHNYIQSFYDPSTKKTTYSYSADNYLQKVMRFFDNPLIPSDKRRKFINEKFGKFEWYRDQSKPEGSGWKSLWLQDAYNNTLKGNRPKGGLPYRNVGSVQYKNEETGEFTTKKYSEWDKQDILYAMMRNWHTGSDDFAFYLSPIFSDSPMTIAVRGKKYSFEELIDGTYDSNGNYHPSGFLMLIDQELDRIKYVTEVREPLIKEGKLQPIACFDGKRGKQFCFLPQLNDRIFGESHESLIEQLQRIKREYDANPEKSSGDLERQLRQAKINAIKTVITQQYNEFVTDMLDCTQAMVEFTGSNEPSNGQLQDAFGLAYVNMCYANTQVVETTTVDPAFYKNGVDFQKRFKEVYAAGSRLNTNSRYGKKIERTLLLADECITSPSYAYIKSILDNAGDRINKKDKEYILSCYRFLDGSEGINVSDAQALRSLSSYMSVIDMMGKLSEIKPSLDRIKNGEWRKEDFDTICQTIKPFVFSVIERQSGIKGQTIPVPQQHKNSELVLLAMYDLISNSLSKSPKLRGINRFLEETVGQDGKPLFDVIQFESAGKTGNQGVININFSPSKVTEFISDKNSTDKTSNDNKTSLDKIASLANIDKNSLLDILGKIDFLANTTENLSDNFDKIKAHLTKLLVDNKLTQSQFNKIMSYFQPSEEEVIDMLRQAACIKNLDGTYTPNPEVSHEIPFEDYMIAQPTPEHHIDAKIPDGSQARNIAVADLPDDFKLTIKDKNGKTTLNKEDLIKLYYDLKVENLLDDYQGLQKIFSSNKSLQDKVMAMAEMSPTYGSNFAEAFSLDKNGNFSLSPNSPTIFKKSQQLICAIIKNVIAKQKVNGAALIQASGIGLRDDLNLVFDSNGKLAGAECYLPATSRGFFEPLMKKVTINGKEVEVLDEKLLAKVGLDKALGYRIPTENKSSILPIIIKGFSPQQNGSAIFLPAEITTLSGSDFDVDKMFVMLSSFHVEKGNDGKSRIIKYEYDFSKTPEQNSRGARNNMVLQIMYGILTSQEGAENMFNPQNFEDVKRTSKMMKILTNRKLLYAFQHEYCNGAEPFDILLKTDTDTLNNLIKDYDKDRSPAFPNTFVHFHTQNMSGGNQLGIYAVQVSATAKFQRANITIKPEYRWSVNGREIFDVDKIFNGLGEHRLKNCSQFVGACADNGKEQTVTDYGSTTDNANIIAYMLRAGLSHQEASLIVNQPIMKKCHYRINKILKGYVNGNINGGDVSSRLLAKAIAGEKLTDKETHDIAALCYKVIKQANDLDELTKISRADSPNGGIAESFAKARIQQYKVELFNKKQLKDDFSFLPITEAINNTDIDLSKDIKNIRQQIQDKRMSMLTGFYNLGIKSLNKLASPYFFMLDEKFDKNIIQPILYNLPKRMSDDKRAEIIEAVYNDYITYVLSGYGLFGDELTASSMKKKREYYLNDYPQHFLNILNSNKDIRDLIGSFIVVRGGKIMTENLGQLGKGQQEELMGRLTELMYLDNPQGKQTLIDLIMYSFYDNGLQFTPNSFSTLFSTEVLSSLDGYNDAFNSLRTSFEKEGFAQNFIAQFYNNHPEIAVTYKMYPGDIIKGSEIVAMRHSTDGITETEINNDINSEPYRFISKENPLTGGITLFARREFNDDIAIYNSITRYGDGQHSIYNSNASYGQLVQDFPYSDPDDMYGFYSQQQQEPESAHNGDTEPQLQLENKVTDSDGNTTFDSNIPEQEYTDFEEISDSSNNSSPFTPNSSLNKYDNYNNEGLSKLKDSFC